MNEFETRDTPLLDTSSREDVERLCIQNLLSGSEERVFFKDLEGRYIMVSAGWLAVEGGGRSLEQVVGKTDLELFDASYAEGALEQEQQVIADGKASVARLEQQTLSGRGTAWVSTTRAPLRDRGGKVIGTFGTTRDVTADVEAQHSLAHRALHDHLTGLPNRVALIDRLAQALVSLERRPGWVGVLFIDLDGFKAINDTLGHEVGDDALIQAAARLTKAARRVDTVARFGGDELVVLCGQMSRREDLEIVAARVVEVLAVPLEGPASALPFGGSVGAACTGAAETEPAELLRQADLAMYAAKRDGGRRFEIYDELVHNRPPRSPITAAGPSHPSDRHMPASAA